MPIKTAQKDWHLNINLPSKTTTKLSFQFNTELTDLNRLTGLLATTVNENKLLKYVFLNNES